MARGIICLKVIGCGGGFRSVDGAPIAGAGGPVGSPMEKRCCRFGGRSGGVASIESKSSVERKWCSGERTVALVDRERSPSDEAASAWVMQ